MHAGHIIKSWLYVTCTLHCPYPLANLREICSAESLGDPGDVRNIHVLRVEQYGAQSIVNGRLISYIDTGTK